MKAGTKLSENAISGLQCTLFTVELEFINLFVVIIFTFQVAIIHNEKIPTYLQVPNILNFEDRQKEGR